MGKKTYMCLFPWQHAKHEEHAQFQRCVLSLTPADLPTTSSVMCAVKVLTSTMCGCGSRYACEECECVLPKAD